MPALVVVPDGGIMSQWEEALKSSKTKQAAIAFRGGYGKIVGQTMDWKHPVVLALVTTLGLRARDGALPSAMLKHFGLIIFDEVHQIGAPMFSETAKPFFGKRIGLTATAQREDGLDPIYLYNIGRVFYSDLSQDLKPSVSFIRTPFSLESEEYTTYGMPNVGILRSTMGQSVGASMPRIHLLRSLLAEGRKILALSHSKIQLEILHDMFPGSGLIISETERDTRMAELRNHQLTFAISRLGSQGVDDSSLDTLVALTSFRSKIALQQSLGRIQRLHPSKKPPKAFFFEDDVPEIFGMNKAAKRFFKAQGFPTKVEEPPRKWLVLSAADTNRFNALLKKHAGSAKEVVDEDVEESEAPEVPPRSPRRRASRE